MRIKTLQDYADQDYSLTRTEREDYIVVPREDFNRIMNCVRQHSYKLSSDIRQAQRKQEQGAKELEKMIQEVNDVDHLYTTYYIDENQSEEYNEDND